MKKSTNLILISVVIVIMAFGFTMGFEKDQENSRQNVQTETTVVPARYNPELAVVGPDFTTAAENTVNGVVHIRSEFLRKSAYDDMFAPFREFFGEPYGGRERTYSGFGSGVIISEDGFIVTNNHVVEGANYLEVILNDKRKFEAEVIGLDPQTDLALIKIDAASLPYIPYGNSDEVRIGEWVLAVGNPFNLTSTVTAGIVSAKARNINILGVPGAIESFIQTDAAVNRGNSGGALVNTEGELVGINAAIASNTGAYAGYSFAIPVNIAKKVVDDLLNYGKVQRAYLGVIIREVDANLAEEKGLSTVSGVYIERLSDDGGAAEAGLETGDVIVSVDKTDVKTTSQLLEIVGQHTPGDLVSVVVLREDDRLVYNVELRNETGSTDVMKKDDNFYISDLGATFKPVDGEVKKDLNLNYGLEVTKLKDGLLRNGGVKEGFIILEINNMTISTRDDVVQAMQNVKGGVIRVEGVYPNGMRMNYGFIQ